CQKYISAPFTF
nr:immunoglobulin light chain junction region [Macaca mulatta]